ncbi:signal recognition particle-docking protein FtsY [Candidatus Poriferisocius sp.]|uniref:signal recognition particle-docking protein FtsY n=1 Tax=Candidatus Poriferisocius sp. TaxID=3101276 RepID=UPI003B02824C
MRRRKLRKKDRLELPEEQEEAGSEVDAEQPKEPEDWPSPPVEQSDAEQPKEPEDWPSPPVEQSDAEQPKEPEDWPSPPVEQSDAEQDSERAGLRNRLSSARGALSGFLASVVSRGVDDATWEELEEALILADAGVGATTALLDRLKEQAKADKVTDSDGLVALLKAQVAEGLSGRDLELRAEGNPAVWLFVGVNGAGKTTTIGKLAARQVRDGRRVVLAAGDTFRAAAVEQLGQWADRSGAELVRGAEGADPSSVVFDAIEHASAAGAPLVMADTAGRLPTRTNLMDELAKIYRVAGKGPGVVAEVLLVIDASTGQNGLAQARRFTESAELTGVVLTKLDGSAKGGIVMAVQNELDVPVKLVGLGEGLDDLVEFDAVEFAEALFS